MNSPTIDPSDIQGLVRFGFGRMTEACFFLLRVRSPEAARAWLATAPVTSGEEMKPPPTTALQVAFTSAGLLELGLPPNLLNLFAPEFVSGMAGDDSRSRRLGDVEANAPSQWQWGAPSNVPHLIVMLYAAPGQLESWKQFVKAKSWATAFEELRCLPTSNLDGVEPFGFADGISQPELDWERKRAADGKDQ